MSKFVMYFFTVVLAIGWAVMLVGCYILQKDKQIARDEKRKKEKEIEKTSAADLVSMSDNAESHRQRKSKICDEFRANTDAILADLLRSASKNAGSSDSGRGRNKNKPLL